jgi:hypothetical protein
MKLRAWACLAGFLTLTVSGAHAAVKCEPGTIEAKALSFDLKDEGTASGMLLSLAFGLSPADRFPFSEIAEVRETCERGKFKVGTTVARLQGHDDLPPRWAAVDGIRDIIFFVCLMPRPSAALALSESTTAARFDESDMMYALVMATQDKRYVYGFYDAIPDDKTLAALATAIMNDEGRILAELDVAKNAVSFAD